MVKLANQANKEFFFRILENTDLIITKLITLKDLQEEV